MTIMNKNQFKFYFNKIIKYFMCRVLRSLSLFNFEENHEIATVESFGAGWSPLHRGFSTPFEAASPAG